MVSNIDDIHSSQCRFLQIEGRSIEFYGLIAILALLLVLALGSFYYMEHNGHWVTGMSNKVIWGMPHVFAILLIIAASGALNIASVASVFNKQLYKPLSRLSALIAMALLAGGLMVLVLDLGRPDRLLIAMTNYNFKSIFAWNIILYNGFFVAVLVYIWFMFEKRMNKHSHNAGVIAFAWRLILTTGTGSIFGFIVSRHAFDNIILAPMFVTMSFSFGLSFFLIILLSSFKWTSREIGELIISRLRRLLGVFIAAVLYFVTVYHIGNLYLAKNAEIEYFILFSGNIYSNLFWYGQILLGSLVPLFLIYYPQFSKNNSALILASILVIIGGGIQLYIIIIGSQVFPIEIFPGMDIISGYANIANYIPSIYEILLGIGGIALALIMVSLAVKMVPYLPENLADSNLEKNI